MQYDTSERASLFAPRSLSNGLNVETRNEDVLRHLGASQKDIERVNERSQREGVDSLVLYCQLHGITRITQ